MSAAGPINDDVRAREDSTCVAHPVRCEHFKGTWAHAYAHAQAASLNQGGALVLVFFFFLNVKLPGRVWKNLKRE